MNMLTSNGEIAEPRGSAIPPDQAAVLALQRRSEPPLDVQQDPAQVSATSYRLQDQLHGTLSKNDRMSISSTQSARQQRSRHTRNA